MLKSFFKFLVVIIEYLLICKVKYFFSYFEHNTKK